MFSFFPHFYPMQKEFLKSCEGFLRAALTVHGHPILSEELHKWHFLTPACNLSEVEPGLLVIQIQVQAVCILQSIF